MTREKNTHILYGQFVMLQIVLLWCFHVRPWSGLYGYICDAKTAR